MDHRKVEGLKSFSQEKLNKVALFSSERSMTDLYCVLPGQSQKPHVHEASDKVFYVISGKGTFTIGGEEAVLSPGELTIARPGENHALANRGSEPLLVLVFMAPRP
ncbi:MAG: cupin domain-containing protein [Candidatus Tectomicrobia bacterium]|uniref:Cupin domain-containing protein n=1 Tax=Tectimicrobiota bacterium TaxID=2528274 RepID=A0A932M0M2_UNCTE|nr:cupin domain-containing protein [Candidatus Tectomicrobia bacterium]